MGEAAKKDGVGRGETTHETAAEVEKLRLQRRTKQTKLAILLRSFPTQR